jgi:hypothetical protein
VYQAKQQKKRKTAAIIRSETKSRRWLLLASFISQWQKKGPNKWQKTCVLKKTRQTKRKKNRENEGATKNPPILCFYKKQQTK